MAKRKIQKGPSWVEVGLGAVLSMILGVVLGALYLVTKPVTTAKEIPKDAPSGAIYFLEGSRNASGNADETRKKFVAGESVDVTEADVNAIVGDYTSPLKAAPEKPGDKPATSDKLITPGQVNVRIRSSEIQFACPVDYNIFTVMGTIIVQATGTFEKRGPTFEFVPDSILVGGCQVVHIPVVKDMVLTKILFAHPIPDELGNAWGKLATIAVDGSTLRLKMP